MLIINHILQNITIYGTMIALGILISGAWGCLMAKRFGYSAEDVIIVEAYAVMFAIIFAKLLYLIVNVSLIEWNRIMEIEYVKLIAGGGFVFLGGFIGGAISLYFIYKAHKIHSLQIIELMLPGLAFAQFLGRIGCRFAGCCYGIRYSGPMHIIYTHSSYAPNNIALFPVQYAESVSCLILSVILGIYVLKRGAQFTTALIYLSGYGTIRFILEFFRGDTLERGIYFGLSTSQWISLAMIIVAAAAAVINKKRIIKHNR